jgi:hypothetical protein
VPPNYAFERLGSLSSLARVKRDHYFALATRMMCLRPDAQRER